jgi:hypothetical protein
VIKVRLVRSLYGSIHKTLSCPPLFYYSIIGNSEMKNLLSTKQWALILLPPFSSVCWLLILFAPFAKPPVLYANVAWFTRFWFSYEMFGSYSDQNPLNTSDPASDWLQFSPYGVAIVAIRILTLGYSTVGDFPPIAGFSILGVAILLAWQCFWWWNRHTTVSIFAVASLVGVLVASWSPVLLAASLVIPIMFRTHRSNWRRQLSLISGAFILFPSLLGLITTSIALVTMVLLIWKDQIAELRVRNFCLALGLLVFGTSSTVWLKEFKPVFSLTNQSLHTSSFGILQDAIAKHMTDYSRDRLDFPPSEKSSEQIPLERFRLERTKGESVYLSYFFSQDWGDSFNPKNSPRVTLYSESQRMKLNPTWRQNTETTFTYELSYLHVGKLVLLVPRSIVTANSLGWIEIEK